MARIGQAAVVGGGVIGGGWIARFAQNGVDVSVYDPDPEAEAKLGRLMANADHAFSRLIDGATPKRGAIRFASTLAEAVADADLVQESAPERLDLKQRLLAGIDGHAKPDAIVASSTSGLLPTDLQANMARPERLVVAHPFNPVYLIPLVELVGGERTAAATIERASAVYASLGMKPVHIRKEIDAFVGDRLLEALWREALWLVNDDVATVEEVDEVIRYSFGLRWAQMGLFQTYRIAGGEAGMRHFMAQFGPCLQWPWTKLTDVPELTDALVDKISDQSDAQAGGLSIRELERIRDDNLVAIMRALEKQDWGAGALLRAYRRDLSGEAAESGVAPLRLHEVAVPDDWLDYNGHMTEHRYGQVFGDATDAVLAHLGMDAAYLATGRSFYTVETHIRHLAEGKRGDRLAVESQVLSADDKRLKLFHTIRRADDDTVLATGEHMLIHVDTVAGRAVAAEGAMRDGLARLAASHAGLVPPEGAGRFVGERR